MPAATCRSLPGAAKPPADKTELPPTIAIFSMQSTSAPFVRASMAAERPEKPEPTTNTSTVRSHFGSGRQGCA